MSVRGIGVAVITSDVDGVSLGGQGHALLDAEAVLLVDDGERQILEDDIVLDERVRADEDADRAVRQPRQDLFARAALLAAGQKRDLDAALRRKLGERGEMLARRESPSAPSAPPARPPRPRPPSPRAPPPSCRCRHRLAAGAACAKAAAMSAAISAMAFRWPGVSAKGREAMSCLRNAPAAPSARPGSFFWCWRTRARASWLASSSSKARRCARRRVGQKVRRRLRRVRRAQRPRATTATSAAPRMSGSSHSGSSGARSSAASTAFCTMRRLKPAVSG